MESDLDIVGAWRTKASGSKLAMTVEVFAPIGRQARAAIEREAAGVAQLRGRDLTDVAIKSP